MQTPFSPPPSIPAGDGVGFFSPQNLDKAAQKFLQWDGVYTRTMFLVKEEEVAEWIEQITRQRIARSSSTPLSTSLWQSLSDGVMLCTLVNNLSPNSIPVLPKKTFKRVKAFLEQIGDLGVAEEQLFHPMHLIYKRNMVHVVYCLHSLAAICHARRLAPFFTGQNVTDRKKKREEFKRQAKESPKKTFEGWKLSTPLLQQITEEPAPVSATVYVAKLESDIQQQAQEFQQQEEAQKEAQEAQKAMDDMPEFHPTPLDVVDPIPQYHKAKGSSVGASLLFVSVAWLGCAAAWMWTFNLNHANLPMPL